VTIPDHLRARQSTAINDTGVIELIGKDGVVLLGQGGNHSQIGVEA
jgi:hypothetical protein